jgi:biopolymer transport protein ExbD
MPRAFTICATALLLAITSGCKEETANDPDTLRIEVRADSILEFRDVLDAVRVLLGDREDVLVRLGGPEDLRLWFRSVRGFPGEPTLVHVSPESIAIGGGPARQEVTLERLGEMLASLKPASNDETVSGVLLYADKNVSREFGFKVLTTMSDAGVHSFLLWTDDVPAVSPEAPRKKPAWPSQK